MKMNKIGIVITDGVGFRNFILSDFIKELEINYEKVVIYSFIPAHIYKPYITTSDVRELETINSNFFN